MTDRSPAIAYAALVILGGALGGVIYLGTRPGPSTPGGTVVAPTSTTTAPTTATTTTPTPATPAGSASTPGALTFVASADLTPEEQAILERLNQVRANPPAFLEDWKQTMKTERGRGNCTETEDQLDPLKAYEPRQPLAANQQLTNAARAHAKDEIARSFFTHVNPDGIGSNQRIVAAGYPLPIGATIGSFTYGGERDSANTESIYGAWSSSVTTFTAAEWPEAIDVLIVDTCVPTRGHRDHLLGRIGTSKLEPEVGVGGVADISPKTKHSELQVVIETATKNDGLHYVLGVVYRDADGDSRYDIGEGVAGVQINLAAAGVTTKTGPGGGYALPVKDGTTGELTTGGGAKLPLAIKGANVKLDIKVP